MRTGLLSDLSVIGYEIFLEGETIRLRYQKPDTPPESARRLIDELRKYKAEAVNILKTGNTITSPKIVESEAIVNAIWVNPHKQGTPEARRASLMVVMKATWTKEFQGIIKKVLGEQARLIDFQAAVEAWEQMVKGG